MARIELRDVSLTFRVRPRGSRISLKEFLLCQAFRRTVPSKVEVAALRNINLTIHEGERVGIIGGNGAGKSTLLKLIAGIYPPTRGCRLVEGRISSLFDIAHGFEPEASGWDNIAYRSYFQGESPQSVRAKRRSIAEFAELGPFLDMPVRYYSNGMLVRLAFAIATAIDPEILLIDEVLSVGDRAFQRKARERMDAMMARARLLVLVSHDLEALAPMCTKVVWMEAGQIRQIGAPREVIAAYANQSTPALATA